MSEIIKRTIRLHFLMIIGITGKYCAGKDLAAEYIVSKGFTHYSLSNFIREEAKRRNLVSDRPTLINLGNELRERYGPGVLGKKALEQFEPGKNYVVSSIRNPAEVKELRASPAFTLVGLDAPLDLRWKRMQERPDKQDNIRTYEEFVASERAEQSADPTKQQLHLVFTLADVVIMNDSSKEQLYSQIDQLLRQ